MPCGFKRLLFCLELWKCSQDLLWRNRWDGLFAGRQPSDHSYSNSLNGAVVRWRVVCGKVGDEPQVGVSLRNQHQPIVLRDRVGETSRHRDTEFEAPPLTREPLMALWEAGWDCLFHALEPLSEADVGRRVTIRGEAHSVMQAINRQIAHYSYHVGQIVLLAKHYQHSQWRSLSVPRGKSADFNRRVTAGEASQR